MKCCGPFRAAGGGQLLTHLFRLLRAHFLWIGKEVLWAAFQMPLKGEGGGQLVPAIKHQEPQSSAVLGHDLGGLILFLGNIGTT